MTATGMAAMTDEELIALEALKKERDALIVGRDMMGRLWGKEKARAERLEAALQAILSTAYADDHVGWQTALECRIWQGQAEAAEAEVKKLRGGAYVLCRRKLIRKTVYERFAARILAALADGGKDG